MKRLVIDSLVYGGGEDSVGIFHGHHRSFPRFSCCLLGGGRRSRCRKFDCTGHSKIPVLLKWFTFNGVPDRGWGGPGGAAEAAVFRWRRIKRQVCASMKWPACTCRSRSPFLLWRRKFILVASCLFFRGTPFHTSHVHRGALTYVVASFLTRTTHGWPWLHGTELSCRVGRTPSHVRSRKTWQWTGALRFRWRRSSEIGRCNGTTIEWNHQFSLLVDDANVEMLEVLVLDGNSPQRGRKPLASCKIPLMRWEVWHIQRPWTL